MNADAIALASVISSGAVGLTGVIVAAISGWRDRRHSGEEAETERQQRRLAEAYVDLLQTAERTGQWVSAIHPVIDTVPPQPVPGPPDVTEQARSWALLGAFASEQV